MQAWTVLPVSIPIPSQPQPRSPEQRLSQGAGGWLGLPHAGAHGARKLCPSLSRHRKWEPNLARLKCTLASFHGISTHPTRSWTGHTANNFPFKSKQWWKPSAPWGLCAYNWRKKHPCQRDSLTGVKLGTNPLGPFHLILVFLTSTSVSRICSLLFKASKSQGQINIEILGRTENSLHSSKTVLYFKCFILQSSALPNTHKILVIYQHILCNFRSNSLKMMTFLIHFSVCGWALISFIHSHVTSDLIHIREMKMKTYYRQALKKVFWRMSCIWSKSNQVLNTFTTIYHSKGDLT